MRALQRIFFTLFVAVAVGLLAGMVYWASRKGDPPPVMAEASEPIEPLRIGLVPERDIFVQHRRYQKLTEHLAARLDRPVELVTVRSYRDILQELREGRIDAAFLGSLTAVLAIDEVGARVLVRPEARDGANVYRGVIFVREDSPVRSIEDLAGRSIAMVPTTTGACLFPVSEFVKRGMFGPAVRSPQIVNVGTHDDAILEVCDGRVEAGAVKSTRLDAFERENPTPRIRRLASSDAVPENALVLRADFPEPLTDQLDRVMQSMHADPAGQSALRDFGAARFIPTLNVEYEAVYRMIEQAGPAAWERVDPRRPPPERPYPRPAPSTDPAVE